MRAIQTTKYPETFRSIMIAVLLLTFATGIGWLFRAMGFPETNIVIVYLLSVLLIARATDGFYYGTASSFVAALAFNFFFTEPYYTLKVNNAAYFITFSIMVITAIITSTLTSKVKQNAVIALEKESQTDALYRFTNLLTEENNISEIAAVTVKTVSKIADCNAGFLPFDENGKPEPTFVQINEQGEPVHRSIEVAKLPKFEPKQLNSRYYTGEEFCDFPVFGRDNVLGSVRIPKECIPFLSEAQMHLLHSMIESAALAIDRFRSAQKRIKLREETMQERCRANLLRAISHDLRTPLSGIMETSEMLMGMTGCSDARFDLMSGIYQDADWLHSLVENILSLTRLQDGKLTINKQPEAVEEVIGAALHTIEKRAPDHEITVNIPDNLLLVPMDAKLISQVLINLLDNAVKHTEPQKEITVSVKVNDGYAECL